HDDDIVAIYDEARPPRSARSMMCRPSDEGDYITSRIDARGRLGEARGGEAGSVVGRVNAQAASRRLFATFNNSRLNAHLAFTVL
ncbi:hypothetical protein NPN16_24320, partial [Vibrio parahaemolyticus]|uniref:hypothetical protein n=1 Tax=Vibrio parahaemolyticus TaxID=670 RepID=UPI002112D9A2